MIFVQISPLPFEFRPTNTIKLNQDGEIERNNEHPADKYVNNNPIHVIRENIGVQLMTSNQIAMYKNHDGKAKNYDQISIFSLQPHEL